VPADFTRLLQDVNIFRGKFGLGACGIVLRNQSREMQSAGESCRAGANDQYIRIQPLTLDRHRFILAEGLISQTPAFKWCFYIAIEEGAPLFSHRKGIF
jgi:hypothetical protein